jgi:hypothetical protein
VILFFLLSVSVLFITEGDLKSLASVYALSFLSVMALFAIGNLLLKVKRRDLPRPSRASWSTVLLAMLAVGIAIWGNSQINQRYLLIFFEYLVPTVLIVTIMLTRVQILELVVFFVDEVRRRIRRERREAIEQANPASAAWWSRASRRINFVDQKLHDTLEQIRAQQIVFFTRGDNIANLNKVMLYIRENEHTNRVKLVSFYENEGDIPPKMAEHIRFLDEVYPEIDMEFVAVKGKFCPAEIERLSKQWDIPMNLMFIGSPSGRLPHRLEDLGGVRLII